ncbi:MAG: elongation factor P [bacterium TMED144]|nr:MAG: elongation factor P [bacterium TMED144]|tara:strand:- start:141 stop:704 length:564 start_codon:yes stop_codon:yes gene_type:complete
MATTSNIKNGSVIFHKNKRMKVVEFLHVKPGKGPAFVRTKLKDILTGKVIDETFNSGVKLEFLKIEAKEMQYLYSDTDSHFFMDNQTFEQVSVLDNIIGKNVNFLKDGMNVDLLFDGSEILDIRLPAHINLKVIETEPGIKGNTATGATKPAKVETEYLVQVPLFVVEGDILKIDTRTGEYIERLKS